MAKFTTVLRRANEDRGWIICGLDPVVGRIPQFLFAKWGHDRTMLIVMFLVPIIDAVAPYVAGFKPNLSFFLKFDDWQRGNFYGQKALVIICQYIRRNYPDHLLILDTKDGDIGASNDGYVQRAVDIGAHAVTWDPYLGVTVARQMERYPDLGFIALARTSNSEGTSFQSAQLSDGRMTYENIVNAWHHLWLARRQVGLVVGATHPDELRTIRDMVGAMPLLVPGIGTQGGNAKQVRLAGYGGTQGALMANASSSVLYAGSGEDYAVKSQKVVCDMSVDMRIAA